MAIKIGKLGIVRLTGSDLEALRRACYERDNHCCTICGRKVLWERGSWQSGHMAHWRNKRMYGDTLENVRLLCMAHHMIDDHNPKSVPSKV